MSGTSSNKKQRGSRRSNGLQQFSGGWQGFVDIDLSAEEKERLAALPPEDFPVAAEVLSELLADGYKFSAVTDEKHACCIVTITGKGEGCVNAGFSLSARGPDFERALLVLCYKHFERCDGGVWDGHQRDDGKQLRLWG
jgi:hypothetical protein